VSRPRLHRALAAVLASIIAAFAASCLACPFCTAVKPSLSQRRESAAAVVLGESVSSSAKTSAFKVHRVLSGIAAAGERIVLPSDSAMKPGALALLFATASSQGGQALDWSSVEVNETSLIYFARAPGLRQPVPERLRYFAPFLEHADPLIAEDAYLEFGHAPFDKVAAAAGALSQPRLRSWIIDPNVPPARKGFYGLALGLASDAAQCRTNSALLERLIAGASDDFRAGFDGLLGGYLLLAGEPGLKQLDERYFANPRAADGDLRHALTAVRFYHEFGREIADDKLCAALRHVLARPEFADRVIVDLARWQDWGALGQVAALYDGAKAARPLNQAVVGYLLACPQPAARAELHRLRRLDPAGVAAAEQVLSTLGGGLGGSGQ